MAVLLRLEQNGSYVLFSVPHTPSSFGPPGGVFKVTPGAHGGLDRSGFQAERLASRGSVMDRDLRGAVPSRRAARFLQWFESGRGRESASECLRRELGEELKEIGHPGLVPLAAGVAFEPVRTVLEPPRRRPGRDDWQLRRFEVHDFVITDQDSARLRDELFRLADDPHESNVIRVCADDIRAGRLEQCLVGPQSAFLIGERRLREDLPALTH
jgi:hypothetical protein